MFEEYKECQSNPRSLSTEVAGELLLGHRHIPFDMVDSARVRAAAEGPGDGYVDFINSMAEAMSYLPQTVGEQVRVARIAAMERAKAAICAAQAKEAYGLEQDIIARHEDEGVYKENPSRGTGAEVALARMEAQHLGPRFVSYAKSVIEHMPFTYDALVRGELNEERAMLLARVTNHVDPGVRELVDRGIAGERGSLEGVGTKELLARAKKEVLAYDNTVDMINHADAMKKRRISLTMMPDGMMRISGLLPVIQGVAIKEALVKALAKRRRVDDERTDSQVVADTVVERITGQDRAARIPLMINLVMTDRTLLVGDSEPALIKGYGTISAEYARWLITGDRTGPDGVNTAETWVRRLYTTPTNGELVAMESEARILPQKLKDLIAVRDQYCRTPYCDAPIRHYDHVYQVVKGGKTTEANTDGRCVWCNQTKETSGWEEAVVLGPRHTILITTPSGQMYRSMAPPLPGTYESPPRPANDLLLTSP
ncbi:HNH endonuclease [Paeniglutamicibacter antarcticus]|uniref:DUF222 domain-containing protein n=2 Tax=Paeniglutamicibacter antarcticus TaxID=494023 RepID=A0ABP9TMC4_9MICC